MKQTLIFLLSLNLVLSSFAFKSGDVQISSASTLWIEAVTDLKMQFSEKAGNNKESDGPLDPEKAMWQLNDRFPAEMSAFSPYLGQNGEQFLMETDGSSEEKIIKGISNDFQNTSWWDAHIDELKSVSNPEKRIAGLLKLFLSAYRINEVADQLEWLNFAAVEAAVNDMKKDPSFNEDKARKKLDELKKIASGGFDGIYKNDPEALAAAERALQLKKEILLANPVLDFDRLMTSRYKIGAAARRVNASGLGTQRNNWSNQLSAARSGFDAEIGELTDLRGSLEYRKIFQPGNSSSVPDLNLHWDAQRVMFSMVDESGNWQVYEVGTDGEGLRKVIESSEEDLEFIDPCNLPDGRIIAVSNVGYHGVPCVNGNDPVGNMMLYDPDNKSLRRLTFDQDANWHPTVANNGRVMYVRWEYTDLTHYFSRIVMHMNPDGTEQRSLYGSGSVFPNSTFDIQPIPNHPTQFVGIISGHHGVVRSGRMMIFDPSVSRKEEKGMIQEIPYRNRPIIPLVKDRLVDGVYPQFIKPYPVNDKYFFVTAKLTPDGLWGLYLVDVFDNMTLIKQAEGEGYIYGIPVRKQPLPPVIPEKINPESKEATVFIQDIYEGEGLPGVPRGTVKSLRVFAYEYAYVRSPSNHIAQGIQSGWDIKRLLGTVPVEEDGSALFTIPANTPVSLQPLDEEGRAIQWMRSWLTGMPGETVSCVGCHEDLNQIPKPKRALAAFNSVKELQPPKGGVRPFTFELEVQPVLERACVACHDGSLKRDFRGGRMDENVPGSLKFSKSYLDLHPYVHRQGPEAGMKVLYPYEYHASTSPLIRMLKKGHHGVQLKEEEWKTLYAWIDLNAPYHSTFIATDNYKEGNQIRRRIDLANKYACNTGVDWEEEIRAYVEYLNNQPKPVPVKPEQEEVNFEEVRVEGFPFDAKKAKAMQAAAGNIRKVVEIVPGIRLNFVKIPAGKLVMGTNNPPSDHSPAYAAEVEESFWMAETEITNAQFRTVFPEHHSRFFDQQWKDHVNEGYPANNPEQPVIRVSWEEAMEFCRQISEKTGLNITLPTEQQWEWACRAGSDQPFWYGGMKDDFGSYENLSDKQMNKMAVTGVNPQPMSEDSDWFPYFSFHPKAEHVNDGNMLAIAPGEYKPNPWNLYDMHGNVAEWTRSVYQPYPGQKELVKSKKIKRVVRGGSWIDPPKSATSYFRKSYLPWQKVYNVGFRVIIRE